MRMSATSSAALGDDTAEVLWRDSDRVFCKLRREGVEGDQYAFVPVVSDDNRSTIESIRGLSHEYDLKDRLDSAWALKPVELATERCLPS